MEEKHSFCGSLSKRRPFTELSACSIVEIVGTSPKSWEDEAKVAAETASKILENLRIAEMVKQDVTIEKGKVELKLQ
jgi:flavin-binding protein dodecin